MSYLRLILALILICNFSAVQAEAPVEATAAASPAETPNVASPNTEEELKRIQEYQLKMIMRMNKAEDLRNAELLKRHEEFIKTIPELSKEKAAS